MMSAAAREAKRERDRLYSEKRREERAAAAKGRRASIRRDAWLAAAEDLYETLATREQTYGPELGSVYHSFDRRRGVVVGFDLAHDRALVAFGEDVRAIGYSAFEGGMR